MTAEATIDTVAERRARLQRQREERARRKLAVAAKRQRQNADGEKRARQTRRRVLMGVAVIKLIGEIGLDASAKLRTELTKRLKPEDQAVVEDLLAGGSDA